MDTAHLLINCAVFTITDCHYERIQLQVVAVDPTVSSSGRSTDARQWGLARNVVLPDNQPADTSIPQEVDMGIFAWIVLGLVAGALA